MIEKIILKILSHACDRKKNYKNSITKLKQNNYFYKKLASMKITQLIRTEFGLSQQALAQYLSIPLSQIAMYETGKRDLPTAALLKLAEIDSCLNPENKIDKTENTLLIAQVSKRNVWLEKQSKELDYQLIIEQRKLETMLIKYQQSIALNTLANSLQSSKSPHAAIFHIQANTGIEKNGLVVQTKQLAKLEGIKAELAFIKSTLLESKQNK